MNADIRTYIADKRAKKIGDDQIKANLIAAGWDPQVVEAGLKADPSDDAPPPPPPAQSGLNSATKDRPVAVVNVATTRGIEYSIMFIGLWISAISIGELLHTAVDSLSSKQNSFESIVPFALSALIVALPIFAFLFLRLQKAELDEPNLRSDPSRKRAIQLTLIVTFLVGVFKIITYVFSLLNGGGDGGFFGLGDYGSSSELAISPIFDLFHTIITLGIAGGIFAYYWHDIHKKDA